MYQARQILAYGTLSTFLIFISIFGFADTVSKLYPTGLKSSLGSNGPLNVEDKANTTLLDISRYKVLGTLSSKQFPIDDPTKRVIIVGDIHGMIEPFQKLLKLIKYQPSQDILLHVGDIVTKGPHKGSLAVLQYMSSSNITGVRGNHDQLVLEWRSWRNWIYTRPCGKEWLDGLEKGWEEAHAHDPSLSLHSWIKDETHVQSEAEKSWWKSIPSGGVLLDDHYRVAKEMSELQYQYLLDLPLRLYVPSAHAFIVHAGLLPSDPRYPVDDTQRQPLARVPTLTRRPLSQTDEPVDEDLQEGGSEDSNATLGSKLSETAINALRNLQEIGILAQIPQNNDPWVTLNLRSITKGGKISKEASTGTPWSKVWQQHMKNCKGYQHKDKLDERGTTVESDDLAEDEAYKKWNLKCYPSTTIYGHAASRGLDIKRWSFGLDSGCVYGKRLSALVIKGTTRVSNSDSQNDPDLMEDGSSTSVEDQKDDDSDDVSINKGKQSRWIPFGDNKRAKVYSVKCHL